jgi:hypothetical protein
MSAKRNCFGVLIVGGMLAGTAPAQSTLPPVSGANNSGTSYVFPQAGSAPGPAPSGGLMSPYNSGSATPLPAPGVVPESPYPFEPMPGSAAQSWANGLGALPVGRDGPIGEELYFWNGPSIPVGGGILSQQLNTGWMAEVGGRVLLFNAARTSAWVARAGVAFQYNDGSGNVNPFDYFGFPVTIRDYFRWSGIYAVGRDWFMVGRSPFGPRDASLRCGWDVGGRYGTSHVNLNLIIDDPLMQSNYLRRHDVFGGFEVGTHLDFEVPMGAWVWVAGVRAEWAYNFTDIMPGQKTNIQDVNILFTTGIRY